MDVVITTTNTVEGRKIEAYLGIVVGEAVMGVNLFKDLFASVRDIVGGRSASYEKELEKGRTEALSELRRKCVELGGNGVVGVDLDYEAITRGQGSMLMISVSGTAVRLR